ncbi:MAG: GIY-YIG nuclease family protein [Calditrichia bacterium]
MNILEIDDLNDLFQFRPAAGCYQLVYHLPKKTVVQVGKLGCLSFPAGYYIYSGSHQRSLDKRIFRHLKKKKKLYWHIDYISVHPEFALKAVILFPDFRFECQLNKKLREICHGTILHPKFGNGDCREQCGGHLMYTADNPLQIFKRHSRYADALLITPSDKLSDFECPPRKNVKTTH